MKYILAVLFLASAVHADSPQARAKAAYAYAQASVASSVKGAEPLFRVTKTKELPTTITLAILETNVRLYIDGASWGERRIIDVPPMPPGRYQYRAKVVYADGDSQEWIVSFNAGEDELIKLTRVRRPYAEPRRSQYSGTPSTAYPQNPYFGNTSGGVCRT